MKARLSSTKTCSITTVLRITQDQYDKFSNEFRQKQQDYTQKLANLQDVDKDYYIKASYLFQLAAKAHELFIGSEIEEKRELLQLTLQDLTFDGKKVHYNLGKPFDSIFDTKGHPVLGRLCDAFRTLDYSELSPLTKHMAQFVQLTA